MKVQLEFTEYDIKTAIAEYVSKRGFYMSSSNVAAIKIATNERGNLYCILGSNLVATPPIR